MRTIEIKPLKMKTLKSKEKVPEFQIVKETQKTITYKKSRIR